MKEEYFKTSQLWTSREHPERDVFITDTCNMYGDNNDNSKHVLWQIANEKEWNKFVCEKLNVISIDEAVHKRSNGTYPYEYGGEKTFKSMKAYIKKWGLELKESSGNKINNNKMLICIAKCPELDCNNERHCIELEHHYQEDIIEKDYCPCSNREIMVDLKEYQLKQCKKCINSELIEFTNDIKNYYLCHEVNEKINNIEFKKECKCFEIK